MGIDSGDEPIINVGMAERASSKFLYGLFFAHLALEKLLKAHVCRALSDLPPRIHALLRLAERANLPQSEAQRLFLTADYTDFDRYQLEGRYPELQPAPPTVDMAREELKQAQEVFEWLNRLL